MDTEATYVCESCGEEIIVPIDPTEGSEQEYIEDCPVCCTPIMIHVHIGREGGISLSGEAEQDMS